MEIHQKTALVTGAAKRVGKAIALGLARKGANILLHHHTSSDEARETFGEIKSLGVACHLIQADLTKSTDITKMVKEVYGLVQSVDVLINSASLFYPTPLDTVQESDWDKLMDANAKGPFLLSKAIGNHMRETQGGKIINIADWSGFRPYKNYAPYCASKGALITLTKALARDLAPHVHVNAIAPGPVLLPPDFKDEDRENIINKTPLGRIGTPEDIVNTVIFLLENDFINGTLLVVDGGRSIV